MMKMDNSEGQYIVYLTKILRNSQCKVVSMNVLLKIQLTCRFLSHCAIGTTKFLDRNDIDIDKNNVSMT